jgi:hypothetical protein
MTGLNSTDQMGFYVSLVGGAFCCLSPKMTLVIFMAINGLNNNINSLVKTGHKYGVESKFIIQIKRLLQH